MNFTLKLVMICRSESIIYYRYNEYYKNGAHSYYRRSFIVYCLCCYTFVAFLRSDETIGMKLGMDIGSLDTLTIIQTVKVACGIC